MAHPVDKEDRENSLSGNSFSKYMKKLPPVKVQYHPCSVTIQSWNYQSAVCNFPFHLFFHFYMYQNARLFTCSLSQSSGVFVLLTLHLSPNHHHHPLYPLSLSRTLLIHLQPWNLFSLKNLLQLECACILSSATLNMQWTSPTFSLHVCYGPTPLLCLYEQFLAASFTRTAQNVASLWISKIHAKARIKLKTGMGQLPFQTTIISH